MDTLSKIKSDFQIVENNLGVAINSLETYENYVNKQFAENLLLNMAIWYENTIPTENLDFKLNVKIETIQTSANLTRLQNAFQKVGKIFTLYCVGGNI